jgi:hypothetical protein
MAKKLKTENTIETTHYRHDEAKRKNIPSAAMEAEGDVPSVKRVKYAYSPHLDPVLRFDPYGRSDKVSRRKADRDRAGDSASSRQQLGTALARMGGQARGARARSFLS